MSNDVSWQPDEIDLLITLVRDRRELYDQSCAGYSNVNIIEKLWREIKVIFPTKSEKQLKRKWQILRSGYRSRRGEKLPSGSGSQTSKKWVYFDALAFLEEHLTERPTTSNLKTHTEVASPASTESDLVDGAYIVDEGGYLIHDENSLSNERGVRSPDPPLTMKFPTSVHKSTKKRTVDDAFVEYLQSKQQVENKKKTSNELFLMSVLEDMEQLSPEQQRIFKIEILCNLEGKLNKQ